MVDNINPNSQFHPYQPMDATHSEMGGGRLSGMLKKIGIDDRSVDKARGSRRRIPAWCSADSPRSSSAWV